MGSIAIKRPRNQQQKKIATGQPKSEKYKTVNRLASIYPFSIRTLHTKHIYKAVPIEKKKM